MSQVIESVRKVVAARVGNRAVTDDTPLVSGGLIDSMSIVDLILDLEDELSVRIPPTEVQPDDFDSINAIVVTVARFR